MSVQSRDQTSDQQNSGEGLMTIDELSLAVGMTVRNTRYYASLGLIPPPERRGRVAWYGDLHRARLEMVRALQDHGFTLQAIERYMATLADGAQVEDLALQRALIAPWTPPSRREAVSARELDRLAGRKLSRSEVDTLVTFGVLQREGKGYVVTANFGNGVDLLDLDISEAGMVAAHDAIERHMESLVAELTDVLRTQVVEPFRRKHPSPEDAEEFERNLARLRQLTLESVVAGFQRAANAVITRSLQR